MTLKQAEGWKASFAKKCFLASLRGSGAWWRPWPTWPHPWGHSPRPSARGGPSGSPGPAARSGSSSGRCRQSSASQERTPGMAIWMMKVFWSWWPVFTLTLAAAGSRCTPAARRWPWAWRCRRPSWWRGCGACGGSGGSAPASCWPGPAHAWSVSVVRRALYASCHLCEHGAEDGGQVVGVRRGDGVAAQRHLHQGQPEAPEVGGHAVLRALQPLRWHVGPGDREYCENIARYY